jgi:hypothetical protein
MRFIPLQGGQAERSPYSLIKEGVCTG